MIIVFEISLILLFCLTLAHGIRRFDTKRLLLAFTIIAVLMAVEENLVMLLTHDYAYYGYYLWIGEFPVCIMLAWVVISYLGFLLASKYNTILGVAAASSIDLILEPAALFFGLWTWNNINSLNYFNAPPQNAVGWLLFTLIGTIILKKPSHLFGVKNEVNI